MYTFGFDGQKATLVSNVVSTNNCLNGKHAHLTKNVYIFFCDCAVNSCVLCIARAYATVHGDFVAN